jgi:hypothetical protein
MPCSPSDISLNVPAGPGIPIPGFGLPFSGVQIPFPAFDLPTEMIEDILALIQGLGAIFPANIFKPNLDMSMKDVLAAIANIFSQIAPFLGLYNMLMPVLNMFICIIEILCALPNPVLIIIKLKKLFAECLPALMAIFPFLALLAMIIALLLLLIALIKYIIEMILAIIDEIIKNILVVSDALTLQDAESTLAVAQKIAALLCFIDNLMSIFVAIAAIMAVIQALAALSGASVCSSEDEEGCCSDVVCPPFIKNSIDGIKIDNASLLYYRQIDSDLTPFAALGFAATGLAFPPIRREKWQVYDETGDSIYPIVSIITPMVSQTLPILGNIYWPEGTLFTKDTSPNSCPYTVDMRILMDPATFNSADTLGPRYIRINDCVVLQKPYVGVMTYDNSLVMNRIHGTFDIAGGKVFEDDGVTPYMVSGEQASLNTLIHMAGYTAFATPPTDDGYGWSGVEMTWYPMHPVLMGYGLITAGCVPEVGFEKTVQNAILAAKGINSVVTKLIPVPNGKLVPSGGILPNVTGAQQCVANATAKLRKSISMATVAEFQATVMTCLGDLQDQTNAAYCGAVIAGISAFDSTFSIDPDAQFTTRPINITVSLRGAGGTEVCANMPEECAGNIADMLSGDATFGVVGPFSYDGYAFFTAELTSTKAGGGTLKIMFNGQVLSTINVGTGYSETSSISENELPYEFIAAITEPAVRRTVSDVSRDGA